MGAMDALRRGATRGFYRAIRVGRRGCWRETVRVLLAPGLVSAQDRRGRRGAEGHIRAQSDWADYLFSGASSRRFYFKGGQTPADKRA